MSEQDTELTESAGIGRRAALARLGLTTAVAYAVPSMLQLDRAAQAGILPSENCPGNAPPGSPACGPGGGPGGGDDEDGGGDG